MPGFMHQADEVNDFSFDLIANVKRKRSAVPAVKTVWPDMVTSFPVDDGPHCIFHPLVQIASEAV